jgi:hypothetical protein
LRLDPGDPYALGNVVEHELAARGPDVLAGRRPSLVAARDRRQVQVDAGADLPWAAYDLAKLHLWLGEDDDGLHALLDAVSSTTHARQVETTLASFERVADQVGTDAWATAVEVLRLALLVHGDIRSSGTDDVLRPPVLVLAGASAADAHADVMGWTEALVTACDGRGGSLVSGGTSSGVSALAPVVARAARAASVGYLPSRLPRGVHADESYDALRRTESRVFSLREPAACWKDLLAAGVRPSDVHVLGIGGGPLTALELHLATAIGANVAVADVGGDAPLAWSSWHRPPRAMVRDAAVLRRWLSS